MVTQDNILDWGVPPIFESRSNDDGAKQKGQKHKDSPEQTFKSDKRCLHPQTDIRGHFFQTDFFH